MKAPKQRAANPKGGYGSYNGTPSKAQRMKGGTGGTTQTRDRRALPEFDIKPPSSQRRP